MEESKANKNILQNFLKKIDSETIFKIAIFLLPFENLFFAPSRGWATITPIILAVYLLFNFKLLIKELLEVKKIIIFFLIGFLLSIINYIFIGVESINVINSIIPLGLGIVILLSFDIFYKKNKEITSIVNILVISYTITIFIGLLEFIAIKFNIEFMYNVFDFIFKRNYLGNDRVQFFFTEPSFIGMHIFGILLPVYLISKNKKILYVMIAYCISAFVFESGVRILLDISVVLLILLFGYLIRNKKYKYVFIIPIVFLLSFIILYNSNYRIKKIIDQGVYADGSLASRYFRIQSSVYGYAKKPIHLFIGYGMGNSIVPLRDGYNEARSQYKSTYLREVIKLGDPNYIDDAVSYCLYIRFISEFGLIFLIISFVYILKLTKNSDFKYKYSLLLIVLYLYLQFESYAFYTLWLYLLIMKYTEKKKIKES